MRPRTWVVDLRHYIIDDDEGADLPDAVFAVASFMFAIVEWVTAVGAGPEGTLTNVPCRRRPNRRRCRGPILAHIVPSDEAIVWTCASCGENGVIRHWQHTLWDRRGARKVGLSGRGDVH